MINMVNRVSKLEDHQEEEALISSICSEENNQVALGREKLGLYPYKLLFNKFSMDA
jgi:hypothetical protein